MASILIASVDTLPRLGGVSMMTHHFANALGRSGHDVVVLGDRDAALPDGIGQDYQLIADVRANPGRREGPEWTAAEHPRVVAKLAQLWSQHRFHHAVAFHPFYFGPPLVEITRRENVKLSTVFHGYELRSQLLLKARWRSFRLKMAHMGPSLSEQVITLAHDTDEILVNSQYTADLVQKTGTSVPVRIIGCGLDLIEAKREISVTPDEHNLKRRRVRSRYGLPPNAKVVGTLGRIVSSKNPEQIVELLARNHELYGLIAGRGDQKEAVEQLALKRGVTDRLRIVEVASEAEKWDMLRAMDVFCLLSSEKPNGQVEGFGIVLLEAACAGVPTIAAKSGGMVDVIEDSVTGLLVPPLDVSALNTAAQSLLDQPKTAAAYVAAAQARVLERFNYSVIADKTVARWQLPTNRHAA